MSTGLRLECFSARGLAAPPPMITPADLDEAHGLGFAAGRAAAFDEGAAAVGAALQALATALDGARAARAAQDAATRREIAALVRAVIARIAPRMRAETLAEHIVQELTDRAAAAPAERCRIRCEEALAAPLRAALARAGIAGVEVTTGSGPVEVAVPGGSLRIDMPAFEAALDRLVADFADFAEGED